MQSLTLTQPLFAAIGLVMFGATIPATAEAATPQQVLPMIGCV